MSPLLVSGDVLGEKYSIVSLIASGSMGEVFEARHVLTNQTVALKVLYPDVIRALGGATRFLNEVRTTSSVEHPGVVRILDAGVDEETYFYVMEFLEGMTFDQWVKSEVPRLSRLLGAVLGVARALARVHRAGIIHRDIKPENVFVTSEEGGGVSVKLLDFGIALQPANTRVTREGCTVGTPLYMSPEQAMRPDHLTPASDIWALGVVLYESLTGQCPFDESTPQAICMKAVNDDHVPITEFRPDVPPILVRLVDDCLQKDPRDRPVDAGALETRLQECISSLDEDDAAPTIISMGSLAVAESQEVDLGMAQTASISSLSGEEALGSVTVAQGRFTEVSVDGEVLTGSVAENAQGDPEPEAAMSASDEIELVWASDDGGLNAGTGPSRWLGWSVAILLVSLVAGIIFISVAEQDPGAPVKGSVGEAPQERPALPTVEGAAIRDTAPAEGAEPELEVAPQDVVEVESPSREPVRPKAKRKSRVKKADGSTEKAPSKAAEAAAEKPGAEVPGTAAAEPAVLDEAQAQPADGERAAVAPEQKEAKAAKPSRPPGSAEPSKAPEDSESPTAPPKTKGENPFLTF